MDVFITRRGGGTGASSLLAAIGVEYPAGSVCTCTHKTSGEVLTAEGIDKYVFSIPEVGEWEVKATLGDESASLTINVEERKVYIAKLNFWDGSLYYLGDEFEAITGGWEAYSYNGNNGGVMKGEMSKGESDITLTTTGGNVAASPVNKVDLTEYTQMTVNVTKDLGSGADNRLEMFISDSDDRSNVVKIMSIGTGTGVKTMPLVDTDDNKLTGEYYVGIGLRASNSVSYTAKFNEVRFT